MPPLRGFSDNAFKTRGDFVQAGIALIKALEQYKSVGKARIKIATTTGTGFSETAAQLEGFARPLWLVAHLFNERSVAEDAGIHLDDWVTGLRNGTDPTHAEYWGDLGDADQRMVEMESIAYALLTSPNPFAFQHDNIARSNLIAWLRQINDHQMSRNNWRWFRVFVNLALTRILGVPMSEVADIMRDDLSILDTFYLGGGWSSDGLWDSGRKQCDYYSGSFAIQFAQLLFVRLAGDFDAEREKTYRQQAREFAAGFWRYFSNNGAAIPFGRSMTYRFAMAAFWSAAAAAGVEFEDPLSSPGIARGMLLRHLRWWAAKPDIFNVDGTLSIGYAYPNMYMGEDYNSPQSTMWCLKPFVIMALAADHSFWTEEEAPYPMTPGSGIASTAYLTQPRHVLCNTPQHHFLLSSGQSSNVKHKGREAKYGKMAYSSSFTFSVPVGTSLEQLAPDSTLSVSIDDGESWTVRSHPFDVLITKLRVDNEIVPAIKSSWRPWRHLDLEVRTMLVAPVSKWPGWHIRVHNVRLSSETMSMHYLDQLECTDGGFAISTQTCGGATIYEKKCRSDMESLGQGDSGWWKTSDSCIVVSEAGASGSMDLTKHFEQIEPDPSTDLLKARRGSLILKPHANTNLMAPRTLLPMTSHTVDMAETTVPRSPSKDHRSFHIVTGIFAVDGAAQTSHAEICQMWRHPPRGRLTTVNGDISLNLDSETDGQ